MNYPVNFDEDYQYLPYKKLGPVNRQAYDQLKEAGYEVVVGLTSEAVDTISKLALEPAIREYCPKDSSERFRDRQSAEAWLSKGRAVFLLINTGDKSVAGYGWAGPGTSEHVNGSATFAIRLAEAGQGRGLATPFARLIISGASVLYDTKDLWLETWESNGGAVHIYNKLGAKEATRISSERPTANGDKVSDTRIYMNLPDNLLNP